MERELRGGLRGKFKKTVLVCTKTVCFKNKQVLKCITFLFNTFTMKTSPDVIKEPKNNDKDLITAISRCLVLKTVIFNQNPKTSRLIPRIIQEPTVSK